MRLGDGIVICRLCNWFYASLQTRLGSCPRGPAVGEHLFKFLYRPVLLRQLNCGVDHVEELLLVPVTKLDDLVVKTRAMRASVERDSAGSCDCQHHCSS